jgi:hypothetical protein
MDERMAGMKVLPSVALMASSWAGQTGDRMAAWTAYLWAVRKDQPTADWMEWPLAHCLAVRWVFLKVGSLENRTAALKAPTLVDQRVAKTVATMDWMTAARMVPRMVRPQVVSWDELMADQRDAHSAAWTEQTVAAA